MYITNCEVVTNRFVPIVETVCLDTDVECQYLFVLSHMTILDQLPELDVLVVLFVNRTKQGADLRLTQI